ncbi:MAG: protein-disulfide reductase DsbD N-terminal domain-containing protein, partial [Pyrinomonadaceae bacterium]
MKRAFVFTFILIVLSVLGAAAQNPVSWTLESESKGKPAVAGKAFKATLKAKVEAPWHLYAIEQPDGGPIPTTITSAAPEIFVIDGKISSPKPITKFDENFKIDTKFFEKEASFEVVIKPLTAANVDDLALNVRYQVCNENTCLPPKTVKVTFAGTEDVKRVFDLPDNTDQSAASK